MFEYAVAWPVATISAQRLCISQNRGIRNPVWGFTVSRQAAMIDDGLPDIQVNVQEEGGPTRTGLIPCEIGTNLIFNTHSLASYFFAKWEPVEFLQSSR